MRLLPDQTGVFDDYKGKIKALKERGFTRDVAEELNRDDLSYLIRVTNDVFMLCHYMGNSEPSPTERAKSVQNLIARIGRETQKRDVSVEKEHPIIEELETLTGKVFESYIEKSAKENPEMRKVQPVSFLKKAVIASVFVVGSVAAKLAWEVHANEVAAQDREHVWESTDDCVKDGFTYAACRASLESANDKVDSAMYSFEYNSFSACRAERAGCMEVEKYDGTKGIFAQSVGWTAYGDSGDNKALYAGNIETDVEPLFLSKDRDVAETKYGRTYDISHFGL